MEEVKDYVMPDIEGMKKYKEEVESFCGMVYPDGYDPDPQKAAPRGKKRSANEEETDGMYLIIKTILNCEH